MAVGRPLRFALFLGIVGALLTTTLSAALGVYRVVGDSMAPALTPGSFVLVDRLGSPPDGYLIGDLVAFQAPAGWETAGEVLVKRVVGLPGEVIAIYEGELHRNGLAVTEPYLAAQGSTEARGRKIGEWVLAPEQFFLLGDNRSPSLDSRLFGPVDGRAIIGRVVFPLTGGERIGSGE
jgi:signal peptidase I